MVALCNQSAPSVHSDPSLTIATALLSSTSLEPSPVPDSSPVVLDLSPLELIAKGRAPVKKEFLLPPSARISLSSSNRGSSILGEAFDIADGSVAASEGKVSAVKKSKRQQKRERQLAKKSADHICNAIAKMNDINACPYGQSCRFNHDLDAFLAQKPPDLPGGCPFIEMNMSCQYGAACRFAGSHLQQHNFKESDDCSNPNELNILEKGFQKILWKNIASFPRADAQLKKLGIVGRAKQRASVKSSTEVSAASSSPSNTDTETTQLALGDQPACDNVGTETFDGESVRAPKKPRTCDEAIIFSSDALNGINVNSVSTSDDFHCGKLKSDDFKECKLSMRERKLIDFRGKLYVAPLTTVGNLPFRRICKQLGADITCGEMAMCTNLLQGQASEWALLRRHSCENIFGVQICGSYPDTVARTAEMIDKECNVDFIDINVGCPIDLVVNKGAGSCLLTKPSRLQQIVKAASASIDCPLTLKVRTGYFEGKNCVQSFIEDVNNWGASALTIHGRTRQQRYSKLADWDYIYKCSNLASDDLQVLGNGDIFSYIDWNEHLSSAKLSTCMVARGVLIKPWLLTEIKEQRHWDITANERFDILKDYSRFGLEHWGSDAKGVETTRHFLLEWLSYMHRYIPVGLLEVIPQKLNWRPPLYYGRNDLETIMASDSAADWVRISEMLLGPAPTNFVFTPRHQSNAYDRAENG